MIRVENINRVVTYVIKGHGTECEIWTMDMSSGQVIYKENSIYPKLYIFV